eukprot:COSAG06_NODE_65168_length_257_cov_1.639241_1_plen_39_part_10
MSYLAMSATGINVPLKLRENAIEQAQRFRSSVTSFAHAA